jgi:hypothetical protein
MIRAVHEHSHELFEPCWVNAQLILPALPCGLVVLVHNDHPDPSCANRRHLAEHLASYRLATCTVDLTKSDEHVAGRLTVDIETLADRLRGVVRFMSEWDDTRGLPIAIFGEGVCGAATLMVAADGMPVIKAAGVYCGRPELARFHLAQVRVPILLVAPGRDDDLVDRNERAFKELACPSQFAVIGNATRCLREVGAAGACQFLIRRWCEQYLHASD